MKQKSSTDILSPDYRPPGYSEQADFIELLAYDEKWPKLAQAEITLIKNALSQKDIVDIQHVGSTAIPGCMAKPVIDIQIAVNSLIKIKALAIKIIESLGYTYWHGNPDKTHMLFIKGLPPLGSKRTHHIHIFEINDPRWHDKLFFRDYLREHPETVAAYVELKQALAKKYRYDREAYTDGKTVFVQKILSHKKA
jgi:GrpB-like predicted nucleotidyltransferase (UPF0157 family)